MQSGCDDYVTKPFAENSLFDKLAQHLSLRYLYMEEPQTEQVRSQIVWQSQSPDQAHLTVQDLQIMPLDWIDSLSQAARVIDEATLHQLIDQIPEQTHQLATALRRLVDNFQFEAIVKLTQP
ncbi:MAG: hypothetical protein KME42_22040 [Tildeniella nuda ZEHNDER 1965/U140]|nr:hypothetical protein [Tildeniella nuda ZEHNDER 1965/U140]